MILGYNPKDSKLINAYNNGDKDVVRYQTGTTNFRVGPEGSGTKATYGYMRKPAPAAATPAAAAPAPAPKTKAEPKAKEEPKGPIEYSPEMQQAKERVQKYEDNIKSGKTSDDIYKTITPEDYSKDTYIKTSGNQSMMDQYDFSAKEFNADIKKSQDSFAKQLAGYDSLTYN